MNRFARIVLPLVGLAIALSGCVVYPANYYRPAYVYRPAYAVAMPCCAYRGGWDRG